jgi:hypothetical protein
MPAYTFVKLPAALTPAGATYALAALIQRDTQALAAAQVYLGKDYTFTGSAPASFGLLSSVTGFAFHGNLTADFLANAALTTPTNPLPVQAADWPSPLPLTAGLQVQLDGVDLVLPEFTDFDALANTWLLICGTEWMAVAESTMTGPGAYTLTVIRGSFSTSIIDHHAGDQIYLVAQKSITPLVHPQLAIGNTIAWKVTLTNPNLSDATAQSAPAPGVSWVSITPDSWAHPSGQTLQIIGAGFLSFGDNPADFPASTYFKLDDGAGHAITSNFSVDGDGFSDTTMQLDLGSGVLTVAGNYTLYYTTNSGSTWISTGLTAVVS